MHEPFNAVAPIVPALRFRRARAVLSRLLPPPIYGDRAIGLTLSPETKRDLRIFSGLLTALPITLLLWVGIYHLILWAL